MMTDTESTPLDGLRVLYVIPHTAASVGYDSVSEYLSLAAYHDDYCTLLHEMGGDVELLILGDEAVTAFESSYDIRSLGVSFGSSFGTELSSQLYRTLRTTNADIVHIQGYNQPNILPVVLSVALADTTVLLHNHGSGLDYSNPKHFIWYQLVRFGLSPLVDRIISVNQNELENLRRVGVSDEKLVHIPNAVDTTLFRPLSTSDCRASLGLRRDRRYLLYVGRITEHKGVSYLVRSLKDIPEDVHLLLVYSGVDENELETINSLIDKYGLDDRITFVGEVAHSRLPEYYNAADICVFPSVNEGFGVVTIEAMACNVPIIVTREHVGGGHIEDGANALVAEPRSAESLAINIRRLLADGSLRRRIAETGYEVVNERYTWESVGEALSETYLAVSNS